MATFVFAYRAPKDYTPGSPEKTAAWSGWFASLGASVQDVGNPVVRRTSVGQCGDETVLGGYSLVTAEDLESAVILAKGCPFASSGGGVEVGELVHIDRGAA